MARPGIMLYFDMLDPIRVLPDADKGKLLVAMLEYGKDGVLPQFDGMLALALGFVQPKIDRDNKEYTRSVQRRQFATACRERKRKGEPEITFDEWLKTMGGCDNHMVSHDINDNQWYPTTTSTGTPSSTPSTTTKTTAKSTAAAAVTGTTNTTADGFAAATAENKKLNYFGGDLGKGVVLLSTEQVGDLLDQLGLDAFNFYVEKLANFIIKNDAKVKSHYETILKWWKEDSAIFPNGGDCDVP